MHKSLLKYLFNSGRPVLIKKNDFMEFIQRINTELTNQYRVEIFSFIDNLLKQAKCPWNSQ
jgi:cobalamin biosynthesis Co2+ chelatase CbiK